MCVNGVSGLRRMGQGELESGVEDGRLAKTPARAGSRTEPNGKMGPRAAELSSMEAAGTQKRQAGLTTW